MYEKVAFHAHVRPRVSVVRLKKIIAEQQLFHENKKPQDRRIHNGCY